MRARRTLILPNSPKLSERLRGLYIFPLSGEIASSATRLLLRRRRTKTFWRESRGSDGQSTPCHATATESGGGHATWKQHLIFCCGDETARFLISSTEWQISSWHTLGREKEQTRVTPQSFVGKNGNVTSSSGLSKKTSARVRDETRARQRQNTTRDLCGPR